MTKSRRPNSRTLGAQHSGNGCFKKSPSVSSERWFSHRPTIVPPSLAAWEKETEEKWKLGNASSKSTLLAGDMSESTVTDWFENFEKTTALRFVASEGQRIFARQSPKDPNRQQRRLQFLGDNMYNNVRPPKDTLETKEERRALNRELMEARNTVVAWAANFVLHRACTRDVRRHSALVLRSKVGAKQGTVELAGTAEWIALKAVLASDSGPEPNYNSFNAPGFAWEVKNNPAEGDVASRLVAVMRTAAHSLEDATQDITFDMLPTPRAHRRAAGRPAGTPHKGAAEEVDAGVDSDSDNSDSDSSSSSGSGTSRSNDDDSDDDGSSDGDSSSDDDGEGAGAGGVDDVAPADQTVFSRADVEHYIKHARRQTIAAIVVGHHVNVSISPSVRRELQLGGRVLRKDKSIAFVEPHDTQSATRAADAKQLDDIIREACSNYCDRKTQKPSTEHDKKRRPQPSDMAAAANPDAPVTVTMLAEAVALAVAANNNAKFGRAPHGNGSDKPGRTHHGNGSDGHGRGGGAGNRGSGHSVGVPGHTGGHGGKRPLCWNCDAVNGKPKAGGKLSGHVTADCPYLKDCSTCGKKHTPGYCYSAAGGSASKAAAPGRSNHGGGGGYDAGRGGNHDSGHGGGGGSPHTDRGGYRNTSHGGANSHGGGGGSRRADRGGDRKRGRYGSK